MRAAIGPWCPAPIGPVPECLPARPLWYGKLRLPMSVQRAAWSRAERDAAQGAVRRPSWLAAVLQSLSRWAVGRWDPPPPPRLFAFAC